MLREPIFVIGPRRRLQVLLQRSRELQLLAIRLVQELDDLGVAHSLWHPILLPVVVDARCYPETVAHKHGVRTAPPRVQAARSWGHILGRKTWQRRSDPARAQT